MKFILSLAVIFFSTTAFSLSMKVEGACAGHLTDGAPIAFLYYSNFNGCKNSARAAISFEHGHERMITGKRSSLPTQPATRVANIAISIPAV